MRKKQKRETGEEEREGGSELPSLLPSLPLSFFSHPSTPLPLPPSPSPPSPSLSLSLLRLRCRLHFAFSYLIRNFSSRCQLANERLMATNKYVTSSGWENNRLVFETRMQSSPASDQTDRMENLPVKLKRL